MKMLVLMTILVSGQHPYELQLRTPTLAACTWTAIALQLAGEIDSWRCADSSTGKTLGFSGRTDMAAYFAEQTGIDAAILCNLADDSRRWVMESPTCAGLTR